MDEVFRQAAAFVLAFGGLATLLVVWINVVAWWDGTSFTDGLAFWSLNGGGLVVAALLLFAAVQLQAVPSPGDPVAPPPDPSPREVQLRESALYDCLTTNHPGTPVEAAFGECGLPWPRDTSRRRRP